METKGILKWGPFWNKVYKGIAGGFAQVPSFVLVVLHPIPATFRYLVPEKAVRER